MNNIFTSISQLFKSAEPIPAGVYHFQSPPDSDSQYRLHLRVEDGGKGLLIINASTILHLNQSATEYAYHLIKKTSLEKVSQKIARRYHINRSDARRDFIEFKQKIQTLLDFPDLDPVSFLDISREDPYTGAAGVPYRLDCAITYQLPDNSNPDLAPVKRVDQELSTEEWEKIINRTWQAGIPHLIFTGGEPTLRDDLIDLIARAEKNGQVTGLLTDGYKLKDQAYRSEILQSGLDHLLFLLTPTDKQSWYALKAVLDEDLHTTVHITLKPDIIGKMPQIVENLKQFGANAISLSISKTTDSRLAQALVSAQTLIAEAGIPLKWDIPVPYSQHNPISLELETDQEEISGSGKAWFYVEPDGDVLPAQGVNQVLGNLLDEKWQGIWRQKKEA
ncbi:MAG: radical SAM protein [Anaerolineales bacterium]